MSFRDKFAIVGMGMVMGPQPGRSLRLLAAEAARLAIEDAGLEARDIDGAIDMRQAPGAGDGPAETDAFPRYLGLPVNFFFSVGRGGAQASLAIPVATTFLANGIARYIVLCGAATDWSRAQKARQSGGERGRTHNEKIGRWGAPLGDLRAVSHHSFLAARHMHEFGTTSEDLGRIAVAVRENAQLNPQAKMYGRPMTLEDHQNSPFFVQPYHLLDICQISDGAVAVVLTTADRARDRPKPPVYVRGFGFGEMMAEDWWEKKNYARLPVRTSKEQAFGMAGLELKDMDFAQLYDCFTGEVLFQIEDFGWCGKGEAGPWLREGHLGPGGDVKINTGGGLLSAYHLGDLTGLSEAVLQLRGEAGARQLPNPQNGFITGPGGEILAPGLCMTFGTLVLGR